MTNRHETHVENALRSQLSTTEAALADAKADIERLLEAVRGSEEARLLTEQALADAQMDRDGLKADLSAHMDAAKVREAALAESREEVERLKNALEQIAEVNRGSTGDFARNALEAPHEST